MIPSGSRKSRSTTRLVLGGGLAAIAATLSAASPDSHMGQQVANHVVLSSQPGSNPCGGIDDFRLERVLASGKLEPFHIPVGRALVVTDVEWQARPIAEDGEFKPGSSVFMSIRLGDGSFGPHAFRSRMIPITEETKTAQAGSSEQLTTGFVVRSGVNICPGVSFAFGDQFSGAERLVKVILRGYLIDMPEPKSP